MHFRSTLLSGTLTLLSFCIAHGLVGAQAGNNNPASNEAPVFLDNHRPPNKKKDKAPTSRYLSGKVVDLNGDPLTGALVTLVDERAQTRNTFITKADGRYHFEDLSFTQDYGLEAKYKTFAAEPRKLSQYDSNANPVRILEIDDTATAQAKSKP